MMISLVFLDEQITVMSYTTNVCQLRW